MNERSVPHEMVIHKNVEGHVCGLDCIIYRSYSEGKEQYIQALWVLPGKAFVPKMM